METTGIEPVSSRCKLPIFPLNYVLQSGGRFELPFKILQISTLPLCYPNSEYFENILNGAVFF